MESAILQETSHEPMSLCSSKLESGSWKAHTLLHVRGVREQLMMRISLGSQVSSVKTIRKLAS